MVTLSKGSEKQRQISDAIKNLRFGPIEGLYAKQFERSCRNLLLAYGLKKVEVTRFSRDAFLRSTNEGGASVRQRTQRRTGCGSSGSKVHSEWAFTWAANKGIQEVCDKRRTQGICTTAHRGLGAMRVMR